MIKTSRICRSWKDKHYYQRARLGSQEYKHPGMVYLKKLSSKADSILDLGCGEGTRLSWLKDNREIDCVGVDISSLAIKLAKKRYANIKTAGIKFIVSNIENFPTTKKFKLVYSAFVLEHLTAPEDFLIHAINLVKKNGWLVFMAPNYGAPNRRSPNSKEGKLVKLLKGFYLDFLDTRELGWKKVEPKDNDCTTIDADTLVEPYLESLVNFCRNRGLRIFAISSLWKLEDRPKNLGKAIIYILGNLNIFPFKYWGPQLFVVARKI